MNDPVLRMSTWKEAKDLIFQGGWAQWLRPLILIGVGGVALPLRAGLPWLELSPGVMLVLRGPGGFLGGRVIDELVSQIDLYPTICELAGIETPLAAAASLASRMSF